MGLPVVRISPSLQMVADVTRPTLAVDWDNTLVHEKTQEWLGGAEEALRALLKSGFTVWIHTCRGNYGAGREMVVSKLLAAGFERWVRSGDLELWLGEGKPNAAVYIDDRAIRFEGWSDLLPELRKLAR